MGSETRPSGKQENKVQNKERCLAFKFYGNHVVEGKVMSLKRAQSRMMVRERGIVSGRFVAVSLRDRRHSMSQLTGTMPRESTADLSKFRSLN